MSDWTDVRDAVPDTGRRVLVTVNTRDFRDNKSDKDEVMMGHYDSGRWVKPVKLGRVTAWMEVPEPYRR